MGSLQVFCPLNVLFVVIIVIIAMLNKAALCVCGILTACFVFLGIFPLVACSLKPADWEACHTKCGKRKDTVGTASIWFIVTAVAWAVSARYFQNRPQQPRT